MIQYMVKEEGLLVSKAFLRVVKSDVHRSSVINAIAWRYDPPLSVFKRLEETMAIITDGETLMGLLKVIIETPALSDFQKILNDIVEKQQPKVNVSA